MRQKVAINQKGFSMVEVILATAIFSIFSASAMVFLFSAIEQEAQTSQTQQATEYAVEGLEAVRAIRDRSFDLLADTSSSGLVFSGGRWEFEGDKDENQQMERSIRIEPVIRNTEGDIVDAGEIVDPEIKKVTSTISWVAPSGQPVSIELYSYLSKWR